MEDRISLRRFQRSTKNCVEKQETEGVGVDLRKNHGPLQITNSSTDDACLKS